MNQSNDNPKNIFLPGGLDNAAPQPIPTEREWFNLFTDIAASLKVQADFVRED